MADVSLLEVLLHGEPIGTLALLPGGHSLLAFNDAYIQNPQRPTLGLWFKDALGNLKTDFRPCSTRVMPYFSNLLPEGRLRDYLAARAGVKPSPDGSPPCPAPRPCISGAATDVNVPNTPLAAPPLRRWLMR